DPDDLEYSPTDNDHDDDYSTTSDLLNNDLDSSTDRPNNENTFDAFHYDLTKHTCERLKNKKIDNYNLEISYKINGCGQLMALNDEHDFDLFITESKNLSSNKIMVIYITLKSNKRKAEKSVEDKSSLSSDEIKLAKIISQIRSKYECNIHNTPCYIEDQNHLQLMPPLLYLWAQDVNAGGATVEVPPFYPAFGMAYAIKVNKQLNILQPTSSISDSVPTLHEFFEQLNKAYDDGNDNYLKLEAAFAREKLTIN
ncbi:2001_t:CDS:2, partial [Ambispora leptoticha]